MEVDDDVNMQGDEHLMKQIGKSSSSSSSSAFTAADGGAGLNDLKWHDFKFNVNSMMDVSRENSSWLEGFWHEYTKEQVVV